MKAVSSIVFWNEENTTPGFSIPRYKASKGVTIDILAPSPTDDS